MSTLPRGDDSGFAVMTRLLSENLTYEPFEVKSREETFAQLAKLREHAPVFHTRSDLWVVSRYADVREIQKNPQLFSSKPNADEGAAFPTDAAEKPEELAQLMALVAGFPSGVSVEELTQTRTIVAADPPDHSRMRRIVNRGFTPARIALLTEKIEAIVDDCLADIDTADTFDVVSRLAIPLPVQMIGDLLGMDADMRLKIKSWSDDFANAAVGEVRGTTAGATLAMGVFKEFSEYFAPLIAQRRENPKDDIISVMVQSMSSETLNTVEALMMSMTVMVAGNETSTNLIGNTLVELWDHPDQLALLREDPSLLAGAVDEANRLTCPIQFNFREALQDIEVAGTTIPKGSTIVLQLASANRDPRQFDDPDSFQITRPPGGNVAFGHGIHFCLGAHLAGSEVRTAIGKLLPHLDRFDLDTSRLQHNPSLLLNGFRRIELTAKA